MKGALLATVSMASFPINLQLQSGEVLSSNDEKRKLGFCLIALSVRYLLNIEDMEW